MSTSPLCKSARHGLFAAAVALAAGSAHASWYSDLSFSNFQVTWSGYETFNGAPSDGLAHTMAIPDMKFPDGSGSFSIGGTTGENAHIELSGTMEIHGFLDPCGTGPDARNDIAFLRFQGSAGQATFENAPAFYACNEGRVTHFQEGRTFSIAWDNFYPGEYIQAEAQAVNQFSFSRVPAIPEAANFWLLLTGLAPLALRALRLGRRAKTKVTLVETATARAAGRREI